MNRELRFCEGCGRTIDEISNWMRMSAEQRRMVMAELPRRLKRVQDADRTPG